MEKKVQVKDYSTKQRHWISSIEIFHISITCKNVMSWTAKQDKAFPVAPETSKSVGQFYEPMHILLHKKAGRIQLHHFYPDTWRSVPWQCEQQINA
jgi:hypothetical protein